MLKLLGRNDAYAFLQIVFFMPLATGNAVDALEVLPVDPARQNVDVLRELYVASRRKVGLAVTLSSVGKPKNPTLAFFYLWALWKNFVEWKPDPSAPYDDERTLLYSGGRKPWDKDIHGIAGTGSKKKIEDEAILVYPPGGGAKAALAPDDTPFDWEEHVPGKEERAEGALEEENRDELTEAVMEDEDDLAEGALEEEEEKEEQAEGALGGAFDWEENTDANEGPPASEDADDALGEGPPSFAVPDVEQFEAALQSGNQGLAMGALQNLRDTPEEQEAAMARSRLDALKGTYGAVIDAWGDVRDALEGYVASV